MNQEVYRDVLNEGYSIHWYEVKSVLGRGAFGVTYLARDKNLDQLVAIKEYFPHDFSTRASGYTVHPTTGEKQELYEWGLNRFIREAQTLAKFKHHNIVRVMSVFELNNTAYMVMEYEQGEELSRVYKRKEKLTEQELLDIFLPIMDGLKLVHNAGFIHRDIKPANIYIREDGSPVLIDFGAARKTIGSPTRAVTSLVTYGYAPFEQYNEGDDKQGAWTDIYALGACLYSAVIGHLPLDAMARGSSLLSNGTDPYKPASLLTAVQYSPGFLRAIDHALMFQAHDRPQNILEWADMLSGKVDVPLLPEAMLKQPAEVDENEATVIMTRPSAGPQSRGPASRRVFSTSAQPVTTPKPEAMRPESFWNVKTMALSLIVLLLFVGVLTAVFWTDNGPLEKVEKQAEKSKPQEIQKDKEQDKQQQLTVLLARADEAWKAGKMLEKDTGAIYLYQQVLEEYPANPVAEKRIQEIIDLYVTRIKSDLEAGDFEKAQNNIQLLQTAVPDSATVLTLLEEIQTVKEKQNRVFQLLKKAEADFKANRLISPRGKNALSAYRQILRTEPNNPDAKQGIETILAHYIALAKKNLKKGNVRNTERNIKNILTVDPNTSEVKKLRSELQILKEQKTRKAQNKKITQLLAQAQRAFKAGNLVKPATKNALALYRSVLKLDKKNLKAKQGIKNVEAKLKSLFKKHLSDDDYVSAESVMRSIESAMPKSKLTRDIRAEWERSKPASRPDIEVISEMIGKFKQGFESRDINALQKLSEFQANRKAFLQQFFKNYTSFKLGISGVKIIGHERKGTANIAVTDLVNIQGVPVDPGTWSKFEIAIHRNSGGKWKIYW